MESTTSSTSTDSEVDELEVLEIIKARENLKKQRNEYLVSWKNGTTSWELRENLCDEDGTILSHLVAFQAKQEVLESQKNKTTKTVNQKNQDKDLADPHILLEKPYPTGVRCQACHDLPTRSLICATITTKLMEKQRTSGKKQKGYNISTFVLFTMANFLSRHNEELAEKKKQGIN